MKEKTLWYGYLDAGQKSTPVARDHQLHTGNQETIYLFNLTRGKILEYQRQVVESKLRELDAEEVAIAKQLKRAYTKARRNFNPHGNRILQFPTPRPSTKDESKEEALEEIAKFAEADSEEFAEDEDRFDENS